ncbi:MAG: HEAT repeat domain-containing protein [Planctomycetaceae bacterium]|nr:HEAT repeat domain-containing protein [Planctomycetaceae bacterium]
MKFSKPLVLLLGGILSTSGMGCSAITAVVSDSRPANRENRGDADRLAAIGRVFENQGRYDKAEVMYRKALKNRPNDPAVRSQLQQLAARRQEQKFGPTGAANAMAVADAVSPPKSAVQQLRRTVAASGNAAVLTTSPQPAAANVPASGPQVSPTSPMYVPPQRQWNQPQQFTAPAAARRPLPPVTPASLTPEIAPGAEFAVNCQPAPASNDGWRSSQSGIITSDDIMVALESPDDHVALLLKTLDGADSSETKALAATLLGDCDSSNTQIRSALVRHQGIQTDPEVLIAICDSQIEREEADQQTVNCLVCLCTGFSSEIQIQATAQLRNFAGTDYESLCLATLMELLASEEPGVRATAALTLGEFKSLDDSAMRVLQDLANADPEVAVRDAATSALKRFDADTIEIIPTQSMTPH